MDMNQIRNTLALALIMPATVLAAPAQSAQGAQATGAREATGCLADDTFLKPELVKRKRVVTQSGKTFGVLRLYGGTAYDATGGPADAGSFYNPYFCLDLVKAPQFEGRTPKQRGEVTIDGYTFSIGGRARTDRVASLMLDDELEGQTFALTYLIPTPTLATHTTMHVTFPKIPVVKG